MMKRFFVILISCLWLAVPLFAQSNKLIRELESKRGALQKQIAESESILKDTKKDVGSQLNSLAVLTGQIEERKRYIMAINNDVDHSVKSRKKRQIYPAACREYNQRRA